MKMRVGRGQRSNVKIISCILQRKEMKLKFKKRKNLKKNQSKLKNYLIMWLERSIISLARLIKKKLYLEQILK